MFRGASPQDAAKQDGDQKCPRMWVRLVRPVNSCRRYLAETPLSELTSFGERDFRWVVHQQVHMVFFAIKLSQFSFEVFADVIHDFFAPGEHVVVEDSATVFGDEHQMCVKVMYDVSTMSNIRVLFPARCHSPIILSVVSESPRRVRRLSCLR